MPDPRRLLSVAALLTALAVLAPFFILFLYAHPQNDDWVSAVSAAYAGVLPATVGWLSTWGGRYSATFLNLLTPLAWGSIDGWRLALAAYALAVPLGIWALVSALASPKSGRLELAAFASIVAALAFGGMPNPAGGLYWMNGAVCYGVGEGLALLAVAATMFGERPGARHSWAWTGAGAGLAAIASGMNEVTALLLIGSLTALMAVQAVGRRVSPRVALILAASLAGLAAVMLMPGTRIRLASGGPAEGRDLLPLLARAIAVSAQEAARWCSTTPIVPVAFLLALAASRARKRDPEWTLPHPGIVGPVAAAALVGTALVPIYGQGVIPTHTLNLVHAVFVFGSVLTASCAGAWFAGRRTAAVRAWVQAAAMATALALAVVPDSAGGSAWSDLSSGRAARYDAALEERYALLRRCGAVCMVPRLSDPPRTLSWFEDAVDEENETPFFLGYKDRSYGAFFGKHRILLAPSR